MGRSRHLERFLPEDLEAATQYYTQEASRVVGINKEHKKHFLRYFDIYKTYQEDWRLPANELSPQAVLQCLYRVEQMVITFINLRNMGRL